MGLSRVVLAAAAAALLLAPRGLSADAAATGSSAAPPAANALDTVTVQAQKDRQTLERAVSAFVSSAIVHDRYRSLARWREPICPLVAGLPREQGEFVLVRLSEIARTAGAPLAGEKCTVNLYVVLTRDPLRLLDKWQRRAPRLFSIREGAMPVKRFLNTPRPVRVWYNAEFTGADGSAFYSETFGSPGAIQQYPTNSHAYGSRLRYDDVRGIASAIVVVDTNRVSALTVGQLADYIAMVGLAEVNLDKDLGVAPTILRLFTASGGEPAAGLSRWDQALLRSLYHTPQADVMQLSEIKTQALREITAVRAPQ